MADAEDIQPLVCDNGTGMVKVHYLDILSVKFFSLNWCYKPPLIFILQKLPVCFLLIEQCITTLLCDQII